jgi:hypothetical protein
MVPSYSPTAATSIINKGKTLSVSVMTMKHLKTRVELTSKMCILNIPQTMDNVQDNYGVMDVPLLKTLKIIFICSLCFFPLKVRDHDCLSLESVWNDDIILTE